MKKNLELIIELKKYKKRVLMVRLLAIPLILVLMVAYMFNINMFIIIPLELIFIFVVMIFIGIPSIKKVKEIQEKILES